MKLFICQTAISAYFLVSEPPKGEDVEVDLKKKPKQFWEINYRKATDEILKHVLKRKQFYLLMGVRFGFTIVVYVVPPYYKAFGLALDCRYCNISVYRDTLNQMLFIADDDAFITLWVSTLSGLTQMTSRFVYGSLLDFVPFSLLVGVQSLILGTGLIFFYTMANLGEIPYVLWLHLIYLTFPGIYAILPGECQRT